MTNPYTKDDLQSFIDSKELEAHILQLDAPTPTVPDAAEAVGASVDQIVKSVLFMVEDRPVMTITCGPENVERRVLSNKYGVGKKKVRLANPTQVLNHTGYPVGTVPPFGYPHPLDTLIDPAVLTQDEVYAGGGEHNTLLRIAPQLIVHTTRAEILNLHSLTE